MAKRKTLPPVRLLGILKKVLNENAHQLMAEAGIPGSYPHENLAFPRFCQNLTITPTLGVMFRPLTNDPQDYKCVGTWYPHYEQASMHLSKGHNPIIIREHANINDVRDTSPKQMAFGITFEFRYFNVQAYLMPSGIQSLCDDPGGLCDKAGIHIQSKRSTIKPDAIDNKQLTDSKAGIKRFEKWILASTAFLIKQHLKTAAQHRKGIIGTMRAELQAEDQFHNTVTGIKRMYESRFPNRTLHHTFVDVVNKTGCFTGRGSLRTGLPLYYEFQRNQSVSFCLDFKRQLWLILSGGKKQSILSASNYIVSTVSLRAHPGNTWINRRIRAVLEKGMYIPEEEPEFVRERPPRKQLVIVQRKSPAEEPG